MTGLVAEEIMQACDEQIGRNEGSDETAASSAVQLMRALKHKNMEAVSIYVCVHSLNDSFLG